jgi:hypothetical protein
MSRRILSVTCLTLSLASCSAFGKGPTCPQPPAELLLPAKPLGTKGEAPAVTQGEVLGQYVEDIGRFEELRLKHNALADWHIKECAHGG